MAYSRIISIAIGFAITLAIEAPIEMTLDSHSRLAFTRYNYQNQIEVDKMAYNGKTDAQFFFVFINTISLEKKVL